MEELGSEHLNYDDLDSWEVNSAKGDHYKAAHVRDCGECTEFLSRFRQHEMRLRQLRSDGTALPGPDCPTPETWARLASGFTTDQESERLLGHAVRCDACGEELRLAAEYVASVDSGLETNQIDDPQSPRASKIRHMAAQAPHFIRRGLPVRYLALAAGLFVAIAGGLLMWLIMRPNAIDTTANVLAKAYNSRPPFEYRLPGTLPGRPVARRGGNSSVDRSLPLVEAEATIKSALGRPSHDPQWIMLLARLDLLEGNYDEALESLKRLDLAKPDDADILAQLGCAYAIASLETGENTHDFEAIKDLNRALQLRPNNSEALFNLALLYTNRLELSNAELAWRRYLTIDSKSPWAGEAHKQLDEVLKKKISVPLR